ncbi:MAG TPA: hypothetical protein G4N96_10750 [Chloroflexi bacterium]|nr:hypothetical protein [Chloroflexota bacterium]
MSPPGPPACGAKIHSNKKTADDRPLTAEKYLLQRSTVSRRRSMVGGQWSAG